jgi:hypothetical protein
MANMLLDAEGRVRRVFEARVDPEDEFSASWTGINKLCSAIPKGALALIDDLHYQDDDSPKDEFRRFRKIEWADEADWFRPEYHWRGWIPLAKENDYREGAWAMQTKTLLLLAGLTHRGQWRLGTPARTMVRTSVTFWRTLLEEVGASRLYDEECHTPPLFAENEPRKTSYIRTVALQCNALYRGYPF